MAEQSITVMTLCCDPLDYQAIQRAIARRQLFGVIPDGDGNLAARYLAEICRGWEEMLDNSLSERKQDD
jgi:hypothetical protein